MFCIAVAGKILCVSVTRVQSSRRKNLVCKCNTGSDEVSLSSSRVARTQRTCKTIPLGRQCDTLQPVLRK